MTNDLVTIKNLTVRIDEKILLDDVSINLQAKQVVALMGANGSGKSSFAQTLMGDKRYIVSRAGSAHLNEVNLLKMSCEERAKAGLFVAWQNPVTIPGVSLFSLCKSSYESQGKTIEKLTEFKSKLEALALRVGLTKDHIARSFNEGFSGGEKKRVELLQLILLEPKVAILDEIDSGLDVDGLKLVAEIVNEMKLKGTSFILITHYKKLLDYVAVDQIYLMESGKIVKSGDIDLAKEIEELGYGRLSARV